MSGLNPGDPAIISDLLVVFINACSEGFLNIQGYSLWLLSSFIGINIAWFGIKWALGAVDGFKEVVPRIMTISFFVLLINQYVYLIDVIFNSFIKVGLSAGNNTIAKADLLDPGSFIMKGFKATGPLWTSLLDGGVWGAFFNGPRTVITFIGSIFIILAFFLMALQIFLVIFEFYLTTTLGVFLLPFGIIPKFSWIAEKALGSIVTISVKMMVLAFVASICITAINGFSWSGEFQLRELISVCLGSMTVAIVMWRAPSMAAALMTGSSAMDVGNSIMQPALTVAGSAMLGTKGAAGLGRAVKGAAAGVSRTVAAARPSRSP